LVFIDETWAKTNMAPLRGWAPRGKRLKTKVPHGHWKTMTFLAALRHDRIDAPWVLDGPINGESFRTYVEKVLVPTLQRGQIVCMDNLACHKAKAIRQAIRAAGKAVLIAQIFTGPEPHRAGLCQAQTHAAQGRATHNRRPLRSNWTTSWSLLTRGVHKLLQKRRIRSNLKSSGSSVFVVSLALSLSTSILTISLNGRGQARAV
jgi:DDE superfamily endonuclease